jgi:hypothetical protein
MGTQRVRDPMFKQSPLASGPRARAGLLRVGPGRKCVCVGGGGRAHLPTACSHGCPGEFDSSRLLTSHWVINHPLFFFCKNLFMEPQCYVLASFMFLRATPALRSASPFDHSSSSYYYTTASLPIFSLLSSQ